MNAPFVLVFQTFSLIRQRLSRQQRHIESLGWLLISLVKFTVVQWCAFLPFLSRLGLQHFGPPKRRRNRSVSSG